MNPLAKLIITSGAPILAAVAGSPPIQDLILDDHTVYAVPVSGKRITTISFPGPISAIDGAFVTTDPKNPGLFQLAHTKGASYFSARALANEAATNLNVRWNGKTYVFELKESSDPWYSVVLLPRDSAKQRQRRPVTPPRLLGMLDKAKAFPLCAAGDFAPRQPRTSLLGRKERDDVLLAGVNIAGGLGRGVLTV